MLPAISFDSLVSKGVVQTKRDFMSIKTATYLILGNSSSSSGLSKIEWNLGKFFSNKNIVSCRKEWYRMKSIWWMWMKTRFRTKQIQLPLFKIAIDLYWLQRRLRWFASHLLTFKTTFHIIANVTAHSFPIITMWYCIDHRITTCK